MRFASESAMTIAQQIGKVSQNVAIATSAGEFLELARCMLAGRDDPMRARSVAEQSQSGERVRMILRAAVTGGQLSDIPEFRSLSAGFLASVRNFGAFDGMLADFVNVPLRTNVTLVSTGGTGATVA